MAGKQSTTSSQKRAELKALATQQRQGLFQMLAIASDLVSDREYVEQFGGEAQLIDDMSAKEFAHFGGVPTLSTMIRAYRVNPYESVWKEHSYNIWQMIELAEKPEPTKKDKTNWKAVAKELQLKLEVAERERDYYKRIYEEISRINGGRPQQAAAPAA